MFYKRGYHTLTNRFCSYLCLCVYCVCVLLIGTISISILCISQEGFILVESFILVNNLFWWIIFKRKDIVDLCKINVCICKLFIHCNTSCCCLYIAGSVIIYLCVCVSLLVPVCPMWVCLCVTSNQSNSKNHVICANPSVNLMSHCIKHIARCYCYWSTKVQQV